MNRGGGHAPAMGRIRRQIIPVQAQHITQPYCQMANNQHVMGVLPVMGRATPPAVCCWDQQLACDGDAARQRIRASGLWSVVPALATHI
ncbi:hypothetical protein KAM334_13760 [Aeromonas caviae]|nr:hypothetical protein KAM334_13760 [Aeromonas caviae]